MSTRLNQIIAAESGVKSRTEKELTAAHHQLQKSALTSGLSRTYRPKFEDGDVYPPESVKVQVRVDDVIRKVADSLVNLFDVTYTKETANQSAVADVVVGGAVLAHAVPVTYLLFLEKQLVNIATFLAKLPTLDPAESWRFDDQLNLWKTEPIETNKTKKVFRNHVKAEATDRHPAQVEVYSEDQTVGYWTLTKFSGAVPAARVDQLLNRVHLLQDAVKHAREEANSVQVTQQHIGQAVLGWLLFS